MIPEKIDKICYTIGHSNHLFSHFVSLLTSHNVNCIVDVRSSPYSNYTTHFNREELLQKLEREKIDYVYLGNKVGGRYKDPQLLYPNGVVNYKKVREKKEFKEGIQRIIDLLLENKVVSLMCSEKDPFDCHRFVLVSYALTKNGVDMFHILDNGTAIPNDVLEKRLVAKYGQKTLFDSFEVPKNETLDILYEKRNLDIAYMIS